jgi:hypothetical protein
MFEDKALRSQPWRSDQAACLSSSCLTSYTTFTVTGSGKGEKRRRLENGGHSLSGTSSAADMEDINRRFMSFSSSSKLRSYFVPELNDTADITERISQARKLFGSMNKHYWATKYTDRYPSQVKRLL